MKKIATILNVKTAILILTLGLQACTSAEKSTQAESSTSERRVASQFNEKVVISGLDRPWAVVAGPDGNIWITEKRSANILIYNAQFQLQKKLKVSGVTSYVEGGLLDLAFHPQFSRTHWLYLSYTIKVGSGTQTQIVRFTYRDGKLQDQKMLIGGPVSEQGHHYGSRLLFDDHGYLLASFGERYEGAKAQDMNVMHGKIVRITDDGKIPADNPFGPNSAIYTIGNRNPQGLDIHPISRRIFESEHGPSGFDAPGGGDEINEIIAGKNYGWPMYHHKSEPAGFVGPLAEYTPAIAPSGIIFYTGNALPQWKNNLFVAALRGQRLVRLNIDTRGTVRDTEDLLVDKYGRLRDVATSPDGSLLVLAEDGRLIQLN
ncbi:MAG: PQQ-dependent sugar dehydrogenase [Bdellovibrionaceae bacterium]|nr:PQQ-dependent sugar dehydrogenase [Bdellovibrio sp.]